MPEYLSPGVYIEEVPPRLRAIEGVSTSTVGFVGEALRGPVPGWTPFEVPAGVEFDLQPDDAPLLVTSFPEYRRRFGVPPANPGRDGYLGHAVRAFFDNGGKRAFIARVIRDTSTPSNNAAPAQWQIDQGVAYHLTGDVRDGETRVFLDSLRNIDRRSVLIFVRADGSTAAGPIPVSEYDTMGGSVVLEWAPGPLRGSQVVARADEGMRVYRLSGPAASADTEVVLDSVDDIVVGTQLVFISLENGELVSGPIEVNSYDLTTNTVAFTLNSVGADMTDHEGYAALAVYTLASSVAAGLREIEFGSVDGIDASTSEIIFIDRDGVVVAGPMRVDAVAGTTVTLVEAPGELDSIQVAAIAVHIRAEEGPMFWARNPGSWGADLRVAVRNSDRPPVAVMDPVGPLGSTNLVVASIKSFYLGALVHVDDGDGTRYERVVDDILGVDTLRLNDAVRNISTDGFAQVAEIDILVEDHSARGNTEVYRSLSWNSDSDARIRERHYSTVINSRSTLVWVQPPWVGLSGSESPYGSANQPLSRNGFPCGPTANLGRDGQAADRLHFLGEDNGPGQRSGIPSLQDIDDISIIAVPGETDPSIQNALITQAERMRYRFAVLDGTPEPGPGPVVNDILSHRNSYDTSYAAYYTPWVQIAVGERVLSLPPSGHMAGIYARSDTERGVHKAPANEVVRNITGLRSYITTGEQDILNPRGVNAIRQFEGRGIRVWGARTLSSDPALRYVSTRRFLIFLEKSIDRGTQWVVFEPNNPDTWSRVMDSVRAFLNTQWRSGALLGRTAEQAFFVRCDESTMTADDIENGRLICEIGIAIVKPAEFVIFRIEQIAAFGETT